MFGGKGDVDVEGFEQFCLWKLRHEMANVNC
jgi:hypothetical protein